MSDGNIDYRRYTNAELAEALQAIDQHKYPINFENLRTVVLERRQQDPAGMQRLIDSGQRKADVRYSVRFPKTRIVGAPENSLGMTGRGKLEIFGDQIQLRGKSDSLVGRMKRQLKFATADMLSVERADRRFRIRIQPAGQAPQHVTFIAGDEDAEAIAARFPAQTRVAELVDTGEIAEFERRLSVISQRTPVTYALIGINVAVFVAMVFQGAGFLDSDASVHATWGSNLVPVTVGGEWWRLATSMFLHFGVVHLLVNMWVLYANGRLTERMYGSVRFAILYLLAGLCGSMASAWWHPAVNSAGASGAVFGMLGGLLAYMFVKRYRIPAPIIQAQRMSLAAFVAYNILFGLTHPGIDNAAHLGGFLGGVLIGLALARPIDAESRSEPETLRVAAVALCAAVVLVGAAAFVKYSKERLAPAERSAAALVSFAYGESKALGAYNDMVILTKADKLPDAEFAARLSTEVIPFYAKAVGSLHYDPAIPEQEADFEQALAGYVRLRHESLTLMEKSLRASDARGVDRAMEIQRAADAAIEGVNSAAARTQSGGPP